MTHTNERISALENAMETQRREAEKKLNRWRTGAAAALSGILLLWPEMGIAKAPSKKPSLESRVDELEALLVNFSIETNDDGGTDLYIDGANVHIRNGEGNTGMVNAYGNLIVGYNEVRSSGSDNLRSGSHNVVVGDELNYTSYGGIVVGLRNEISGEYASVSGGYNNSAHGYTSSVSGGTSNDASGMFSSVSSGYDNWAYGFSSSVSGGYSNVAFGYSSSVSGGAYNAAGVDGHGGGYGDDGDMGTYSSVSGGVLNTTSGVGSSVNGGYDNAAFGYSSSVSGGAHNTAGIAGDGYYEEGDMGTYSSVSGGVENTTVGVGSSVSGGYQREADEQWEWVAGALHQNQ